MKEKTTNPKTAANIKSGQSDKFLRLEIITILGAKILILTLIWAFFFNGNGVDVSPETIAPHIVTTTNNGK